MGVMNRLMHGLWTAFNPETEEKAPVYSVGAVSTTRPDRIRSFIQSERTIIQSIYTRIAIDASAVMMEHCRVSPDGLYQETINSYLNECLSVQANIDQVGSHLRRDLVLSLLHQGVITVVPIVSEQDPTLTGTLGDIRDIRVGTVTEWYPEHIRTRVYNQKTGLQQEVLVSKKFTPIIENPFYSVMNEPNSTLQRLARKLTLLDNVDEISSSGKLDIIMKLPYVVRGETREKQARDRIEQIQTQLKNSTYGIAYTDSAEDVIQLNRSVENNLLEQVKYLKAEVYNELGLTENIMNGTASDVEMLNYMNRTIEPILDAIVDGMIPKFLTKTARTQGQTIRYFQTPFKLIPISQLADLIDVLSRNQVVTPNEIRPTLGLKPSNEPQANQLINSNMPIDKQITSADGYTVEQIPNEEAMPALPAGSSQADIEEAELDAEMAELGV